MKAEYQIKEGDLVAVTFNGAQLTLSVKAVVISCPYSKGDPWVILDERNRVHYISEGCTITKQIATSSASATPS